MKKLFSTFLLITVVLSASIHVYAGTNDSDETSGYGTSSGLWHYGYNYLGTVTENGSKWDIPYSAYTSVLGNYLEMEGVMMLWGSGSTGEVILRPESEGYSPISFSSTKEYDISASFDTVTHAISHDGYLADDKIVWDWHSLTYTECDLPSSKSLSTKEDLYDRIRKADLKLASTLKMDTNTLTYSNMLDWSNFASVVPLFKDNQDALDSFEKLVMHEAFGVYIETGDTTPSFWFDENDKDLYILFTQKDGDTVLLLSQLVNDSESKDRDYKWSAPIKIIN